MLVFKETYGFCSGVALNFPPSQREDGFDALDF